MRDTHDYLFEKATEGMTAEEVLNYYRNLYHAEPQSTEHGIVARALNEILPRMILSPCKVGDTVYFIGHVSDSIPDFIYDDTITKIGVITRGLLHEKGIDFADIGKTVFITRKEAEQALKEKE